MPKGSKWSSRAEGLRITLSAWCRFRCACHVWCCSHLMCMCACAFARVHVRVRVRVRMCGFLCDKNDNRWQRGQKKTWHTHAMSLSNQGQVFVRRYCPAFQHYLTRIVGPMFDPPITFTLRFEVSPFVHVSLSLSLSLSYNLSLTHAYVLICGCPFDVCLSPSSFLTLSLRLSSLILNFYFHITCKSGMGLEYIWTNVYI